MIIIVPCGIFFFFIIIVIIIILLSLSHVSVFYCALLSVLIFLVSVYLVFYRTLFKLALF